MQVTDSRVIMSHEKPVVAITQDASKNSSSYARDLGSLTAPEMSKVLYDNFDKFTDPGTSHQYVTRDSLYRAAQASGTDGFTNNESMIAAELLRRPALLERLDVGQNGQLDNKIDRENVRLVRDGKEYGTLSSQGNTHLSLQLHASFEKFSDPSDKRFITKASLSEAAKGGEGFTLQDSLLATEVLRRSALMSSLDADGNGSLDGKIDLQNIQNVIVAGDRSSFRSLTDDQVTLKLLSVFKKFVDPNDQKFVTLSSLEHIASSNGNGSFTDQDSLLARELLSRKPLLARLDMDGDGKIGGDTVIEMLFDKYFHHYGEDFSVGPTFAGKGQRVAYTADGQELARYDYVPHPTRFGRGGWVMRLP